jgi:hypothetical protein
MRRRLDHAAMLNDRHEYTQVMQLETAFDAADLIHRARPFISILIYYYSTKELVRYSGFAYRLEQPTSWSAPMSHFEVGEASQISDHGPRALPVDT